MIQLHNMLRLHMSWAAPTGPLHDVVLSSRIRLARNLNGHAFTSRANGRVLAAVLQETFDACRKTKSLARAAYVRLEEIEPLEQTFLVERRLATQALIADPKNRGVAIGEKEVLSCMVNEEDHLRLQAVDSGLCLEDLWSKVDALDDDLSRRLDFAFDPQWGYLTACPTNTGTGLRVSALLHLPGLAHTGQLNGILQGLARLGISARGMYGEGTRVLGDFFQISNATTMGRSETEFLTEVENVVESLVGREKKTRQSLAEGPQKLRVEDAVYRALAILASARSISYEETLQHLSYIRMALSLGWRLRTDLETINELIVFAQPSHVQMHSGKELKTIERDVLRANLLRQRFAK